MKHLFVFIISLIICCEAFSQHKNTYALVIGISQYAEGNNIPGLRYAHKDAEAFAAFLQSGSGGSVPKDNIRLLINENATVAAIYQSLRWLSTNDKRNSLVYIYFAGHGDKETETIFNLGFLLAYNTPRSNYINNALRIEDLNNYANTLSVTNKDNVVLITDACHSGDVTGKGFRSANLVGDALRTVKDNEVRITSCAADQLSAEDKAWGGGRGVFSWYLINGLNGAAYRNNKDVITKKDIQLYLDSCFAHDPILTGSLRKQNPVTKGPDNFPVALFDKKKMPIVSVGFAPSGKSPVLLTALPQNPIDYFFDLVKERGLENYINFAVFDTMANEKIPMTLVDSVYQKIFSIEEVKPLEQQQTEFQTKLSLLHNMLAEDKDKQQMFNEKLVEAIHNYGQEIINLYLKGDAAELERREYYNSFGNGYDHLPKMFAVALKLCDPNDRLHRILEVDMNYFISVAARMKIPITKDPMPLIDHAIAAIKKTFDIEPYHGAYLHNELGILYSLKKDYRSAEVNFLRATQIAPDWGIPWSNLILVYTNTNHFEKAIIAADTARSLQPALQTIYLNEGILYQRKDSLLKAKELFLKSIKINNRHYLPFERLGYLYLNTADYEFANEYFSMAEERKSGQKYQRYPYEDMGIPDNERLRSSGPCDGTIDETANSALTKFHLGIWAFKQNKFTDAERYFKEVIVMDRSNPLAYHFLATVLDSQHRKQEAEPMYLAAIHNFLDDADFDKYLDSAAKLVDSASGRKCLVSEFARNSYDRYDDHYALAKLYESWNHFDEAETLYREIIRANKQDYNAWSLLATMQEKTHRYKDEEELLINYSRVFTEDFDTLLTDFYVRMMHSHPDTPEWFYKAGVTLYKKVVANPHPELLGLFDEPRFDATEFKSEMLFTDTADNENIKFPIAKKAIEYLSAAGRLSLQDDEAVLDISTKLGYLYNWTKLYEKSTRYYKNAIELEPENTGTRLKYIDALSDAGYLSEAMQQLNIVNDRHELNFGTQRSLADYCILSGRFALADTLIKGLKRKVFLKDQKTNELEAKLQLVSNDLVKALSLYKGILSDMPKDSITMYTIARIYSKMKNEKEAWYWMEKAVNSGFRYSYVLDLDPVWNSYRNSAGWKKIRPGISK